MKTFREFIDESMTIQGIPGDDGYSYDKWGRKGGVEAWKKHVSSRHKGVEFSQPSGFHTHAHVGDRKVGQYSHLNNSSKTLD